mmetsp:Transcript_5484/g.7000  ORF Transcript_5484/g.7000 Transcript_5484/m.7000 type:complete len:331 (+) Transcript_5484:147-1139(+)
MTTIGTNRNRNDYDNNLILDLHGQTRDKAIKNSVSYLDRIRFENSNTNTKIWVTIITGTGSHSSNGPVLRTAIEKILKMRQMEYTIQNGKGAFIVNAMSGIQLYAENKNPVCTKIVVIPHSENEGPSLIRRKPPSISIEKFKPSVESKVNDATTTPAIASILSDDNPLPAEVAEYDKTLAHVKGESMSEVIKMRSDEIRERHAMEKAGSLSLELQKEEKASRRKEEESLKIAIDLSSEAAEKDRLKEEEILKNVMEISKLERNSIDDQQQLYYFLELSKKEAMEKNSAAVIEEEEDHELKRALELSSGDIPGFSEEQILQQVMKLSLSNC